MRPSSAVLDPPAAAPDTAARPPSLVRCYLELSKARLTAMVLVTTGTGYLLAAPRPIAWATLGWTLLGTGLAAVGASTFNQLLEIDRDGRMRRTRHRPLPAGHISRWHALAFALLTTGVGVEVLNALVNPLTAALGLANVLTYTLAYTPLKPRTSLNTLIGAICGALPPMMGWTGACSHLSAGGLLLGGILFVWQVPHFLPLVWMYRSDYASGGYRMLPILDPAGRFTCLVINLYALTLLPLGLMLTLCGVAGYLYAAASVALGLGLFLLALQLQRTKTRQNARRLFLGSLLYLPLLLAFLLLDARPQPSASAGVNSSTAMQKDR